MADTKISALTAAGSALSADEFAVNESGASKKVTDAQLATLIWTAPAFAAGSASAGTWPELASGTVLTTEEAGAFEYDGTAFYKGLAASSRAVEVAEYFVCLSSTYTLTSTVSTQKLFNLPTNGALTLPTGLYFFESLFSLSSMDSVSSSNLAFSILGGGTATVTSILHHSVGIDNATAAAATQTGSMTVQGSFPSNVVSGVANGNIQVRAKGSFRVTGTGTLIPSVALGVAAAAVVRIGSYFRCWVAGGSSVTTVGNWA